MNSLDNSQHTALIIRHAESLKTIKAVHGGSGEPLTDIGRNDCISISRFVRNILGCRLLLASLVGSSIPQVKQTGELLGKELGLRFSVDERLRGMNMGVLAGLSDSEATSRYPEVMQRLEAWRKGILSVSDISIPGAESMDTFLNRIKIVIINEMFRNPCTLCIVGTRSVGIAIINLLLEKSELAGQPYTRFRLDPGSVTAITFKQLGYGRLMFFNRTDFLGRTINYPDD